MSEIVCLKSCPQQFHRGLVILLLEGRLDSW